MNQFSISNKQNLQKIAHVFKNYTNDGKTLKLKELLRFVNQLGLASDIFLKDIHFYFPLLQKGKGLSFQEIITFLDFITGKNKSEDQKIQAFKWFDKNGLGQVHTSQLLVLLKKRLPQKQFQMYSQLLGTSYGPLINYIDLFAKGRKYK